MPLNLEVKFPKPLIYKLQNEVFNTNKIICILGYNLLLNY